ncbi:MAG: sulfurtransferase [Candidatus Obscuribacterales bacterium]|nr:sulfurtransferase [Candidatus Obscuribacterales bacterium]
MDIVNIAAYKFVGIPDPASWRAFIKDRCLQLELKGTILLAPEGINMFLAGSRASIDAFLDFLSKEDIFGGRFSSLTVKESLSDYQPFKRMLVRLKKEIITMKHPFIRPEDGRAPSVEPKTLKKWLDQGHDDEGREIVLLDTRNDFEIGVGTFENAVDFNIESFSKFPQALQEILAKENNPLKDKTIVSFCTGGIRCEKAALYMNELKVPYVFQLEGGILRYFEEVGGAHWNGECLVFDQRVALDPELNATENYGRTWDGQLEVLKKIE